MERFAEEVLKYEAVGGRRLEAMPCRIVRMLLRVVFGNGLVAKVPVSWSEFDPSAALVSLDQLPERVKRAIEEARRRRSDGGATSGTLGTESQAP